MSEEQAREDLIRALNRLSTLSPEAGLPNLDNPKQTEQASPFYRIETGSVSWIFPAGVRAEAVAQPNIAPLPNASELLLGLISVRGDLVPIYQLHSLLGDKPPKTAVVMLFGTEAERIGLAVNQLPVRCFFRNSERMANSETDLPAALHHLTNGSFAEGSSTHYCIDVDNLNEVLLQLASHEGDGFGAQANERHKAASIGTSRPSNNTYPPSGAMP